jgi:hypothetical protein
MVRLSRSQPAKRLDNSHAEKCKSGLKDTAEEVWATGNFGSPKCAIRPHFLRRSA